jgi:alanyl-tRNA synthetase
MFASAMQAAVAVLANDINTLGVGFKHHSVLHMLCNNPIIA